MIERIYRRPDVEAMTGLSRSTIYAMMADDTFPTPAVLEEGDVIRTVEIPSGSQGGRPTRVYRVNPLIFEKSHFGSA